MVIFITKERAALWLAEMVSMPVHLFHQITEVGIMCTIELYGRQEVMRRFFCEHGHHFFYSSDGTNYYAPFAFPINFDEIIGNNHTMKRISQQIPHPNKLMCLGSIGTLEAVWASWWDVIRRVPLQKPGYVFAVDRYM